MEFLAATKDGVFILDALDVTPHKEGDKGGYKNGVTNNGLQVKVVAKVPSPPNAVGHTWSPDGELLASVCDEGVGIYDASDGYRKVHMLAKVAPDVGGRAGGVRKVEFSPKMNWMVTYEKWDPQYPENVHVWAIAGEREGERLYSSTLKGYTSGPLPLSVITWTADESLSVELEPGKGFILREAEFGTDEEPKAIIKEKTAANYKHSPLTSGGKMFMLCFIPEVAGGSLARVAMYDTSSPAKPVTEIHLSAGVKDCKMMWNFDGTAALVLANSDVDESGSSYFGSTYLYWLKTDGKAPVQVYGGKDGQVQDFSWSPVAHEFAAIVGAPPSNINLHDGKTSKVKKELGKARRNTLKWNPHGRFLAIGGFGTLAGDLNFWDHEASQELSVGRAALTVECDFGPDGRHFLASTIAPRMNEGNQISMYTYTGEHLFKIEYVPEVIEARHEDTGAGARTKTQALLYTASWRPVGGNRKYESRAASPPRDGKKRLKALSVDSAPDGPKSTTGAYRPRGAGGGGGETNFVAAMMKGEMPESTGRSGGDKWEDGKPKEPQLEDWEIRKIQNDMKKEAKKKEQEKIDADKQARKDAEGDITKGKLKLKQIKQQLEELDTLKDKGWDELTEEDEEQLDNEMELRAECAELEKKFGGLD